ncbi:MAG: hypothetical protein E7331_04340 [Clostridiales bacterium]|nr:hypothetical protein [Clostridiales bacterium]
MKKNNGLSIAGFVVSCCSILIPIYGLVGLVGMILSIVGRIQASKNGQATGLANAGIILGAIMLAGGLITIGIAIGAAGI